jgi:hypothetical protein
MRVHYMHVGSVVCKQSSRVCSSCNLPHKQWKIWTVMGVDIPWWRGERESYLYANYIITQPSIKLINNRYVARESRCPVTAIGGESPMSVSAHADCWWKWPTRYTAKRKQGNRSTVLTIWYNDLQNTTLLLLRVHVCREGVNRRGGSVPFILNPHARWRWSHLQIGRFIPESKTRGKRWTWRRVDSRGDLNILENISLRLPGNYSVVRTVTYRIYRK